MPFLKITVRDTDYSTAEAKDEILDTGYGAVKKSRSTSGNTVLTGDELRETGQNDILQAISGKVPGLNLVYLADGTQTVTIRGGASFSLNNSPLFIVDGITVESLNYVNINDVQQVTVMKEASIYGARGANGAILVKTR
jgi:TonB-dependent SusC/RagA subfamily outer membrane receptor